MKEGDCTTAARKALLAIGGAGRFGMEELNGTI